MLSPEGCGRGGRIDTSCRSDYYKSCNGLGDLLAETNESSRLHLIDFQTKFITECHAVKDAPCVDSSDMRRNHDAISK